jgi:hypothetical protein
VEHGADTVRLECAAEVCDGGEVGLDERAAVAKAVAVEARAREVGPAQRDDRFAACEEGFDERAADEALRAGD